MQSIAVALLVLACTVYAVWSLLPNVMRRGFALRVMNWPWPGFIARKLQRATQASAGCGGCDSCDTQGPPKHPDGSQTIRIHRGRRSH